MYKLLWCLMIVLLAMVASTSFADSANGVAAEERVVTLPNDASRWYISVVGDPQEARYVEILGWFNTDKNLLKLKAQVHFIGLTSDSVIYQERYRPNVTGLPTVRMQKANGAVIYEKSGADLPLTAAGLYGAMADEALSSQGLRPLLPWRRDMERRLDRDPKPEPKPDSQPPVDPPLGHEGTPVFEDRPLTEGNPYVFLPLAIIGGFGVGLAIGYGKKLAAKLHPGV